MAEHTAENATAVNKEGLEINKYIFLIVVDSRKYLCQWSEAREKGEKYRGDNEISFWRVLRAIRFFLIERFRES